MSYKEKIKNLASQIFPELVSIRRHLHEYPELSMQEEATAKFIASKLDEYGIRYTKGVAKHGIVGIIEGTRSDNGSGNPIEDDTSNALNLNTLTGKVIALRADMDALPIIEENESEYKSCNKGVMHACGHDAHMTCLLGAAKILQSLRNEFSGTIKLIFQPSEETFPGGASMMIKEGVLKDPAPVMMFGQHVLPEMPAGKIGLKAGKYMASTDEVYLTVKGRGGHAATPDLNVDPVLIASHIIVALQQIVSRTAPPTLPAVLSFGRFIAEGRTNIIPDEVKIGGTLRTFDEVWRAQAHMRITKMAENIADSMGGKCEVFIDKGYPFLVNDDEVTRQTREAAIEYLGAENVEELDMRMTAEDFAYYSQLVPSCFYRLGVRNESKGIVHNLHTSKFDIDESSLETGAGFMAFLAMVGLSN